MNKKFFQKKLSFFQSKKFLIFGASVLIVTGAFVFYIISTRAAGLLRNVTVAPNTANTDDLTGQTNAQWKFTMTNDTALEAGDVIQVDFPSVSGGPPFTFSSPTVTATSSATTSPSVAVGGSGNLRVAFTLAQALNASTTFFITMNGVNNPLGALTNLQNLTWTFRTGTTTTGVPTDDLTTIKDGPVTATRSLVRAGGAMASDANSAITPSNYAASATNVSYTFTFTASTSIPVGGKINVHFPSEFSLLNATTTTLQDNINGSGAGSPQIAAGAIATTTSNGRYDATLTVSSAVVNAGDVVTVTVEGLTNPVKGVYRPIYIFTQNANGGLLDGSPFPDNTNDTWSGPPPVDSIHIGGDNNITVSVYKESGSATAKLAANEISQVRIGTGCPDKQFFVGFRYLDSNGSTTFSNLLDCNYKIGVMPASTNASSTFFNDFLQPGMMDIPATGGISKNVDLIFGVPNAVWIGTITGGVASATGAGIEAFNDKYMNFMPIFTDTNYTTEGFDGSGIGYFKVKVKTGSSWKLNFEGGVLTSGGNKYWPPVIPITYASTTATTSLGSFAYQLADNTLTITLKNSSGGDTISTNTCVGVMRTGGGIFMPPQEQYCDANSGTNYVFKVPTGDITVQIMRPGVGKPEEYPLAITGATSKTIYISAPTSYISVTVRDSEGTAINGAPVFAQSSSGFGQGMTNTSGAATIYVPAGTYRVEGFAPGLGPLTAQSGVIVTESSNPSATFTVNTSGFRTISGTVTQGGTAVSGVQIGARGTGSTTGGNSTVTNSDGTYTLRVPAGTYQVGGWSQTTGGLIEQTADVSSGNATVNFTLAASGNLVITVVGGINVSPLFGGAFDSTTGRGNGTDTWTTVGNNKIATTTLPAGTYEVNIGSPVTGPISCTGGSSVTITGGSTTAISCDATAVATMVTLSGNVSSGGSNIQNANVWASRVNGPGFYSTLTDSSGNYSIKVPDARTYRVGVKKLGYIAADLDVAVSGNTVQSFTLTAAGATITGSVGLANAWVSAKKTGAETWIGTPTDSAGNYSLDVDTGSSWTIYAEAPCYYKSSGLAASAGDSGKNITLSSISGCSLNTPQVHGITPSTGGIITNGEDLKIDIPANALGTGSDTVSISVQKCDLAVSSTNATPLKNSCQKITATNSSGQTITNLNTKATITIKYSESDLPPGFNESNLQFGYRDTTTGQWEPVAATVDTTNNLIIAQVDHFSDDGPNPGAVPDPPQNLAATAVSTSQINLSWNSVSNATYYDVYRRAPSESTFTAIGSSTSASYSDTGLSAGTTYTYKVTAVNNNGSSAYSSEASASTHYSTASETSGGGGGGLSLPPAVLEVGSDAVSIEGGLSETKSREISLLFNVSTAAHMMISNSSDFSTASWIEYKSSYPWMLIEGDGTKTIYVKFRDNSSAVSAVKNVTIKLIGQGFEEQKTETPVSGTKADGTLIRYENGLKVYVLEGGKKRWIANPKIFNTLGYDWNKIAVIAQVEAYEDGNDKEIPAVAARVEGTLIRYATSPKVYVLEGGKKRWVPDITTFNSLGYQWDNVLVIGDSESFSSGEDKTVEQKISQPTMTGVFTKLLKRGMWGDEVKKLQDKLKSLGFFPADIDSTGYFGPITEQAVKKFQEANGLEPVGYLGTKTREKLNQL